MEQKKRKNSGKKHKKRKTAEKKRKNSGKKQKKRKKQRKKGKKKHTKAVKEEKKEKRRRQSLFLPHHCAHSLPSPKSLSSTGPSIVSAPF